MAVYTMKGISLLESSFKRSQWPLFEAIDASTLENTVDIKRSTQHFSESIFAVHLDVMVQSKNNSDNSELFSISLKIAGLFEVSGPESERLSQFDKINAPAIIYPYVREYVSSISTRAEMPTLLMPPVNFVELARDEPKKE